MDIYNMQNKGRPVPNQFVIDTGRTMIFKSYDTFIAIYSREEEKIYLTKEYFSKTTKRYLNLFLTSLPGVEQIEATTEQIKQLAEEAIQ